MTVYHSKRVRLPYCPPRATSRTGIRLVCTQQDGVRLPGCPPDFVVEGAPARATIVPWAHNPRATWRCLLMAGNSALYRIVAVRVRAASPTRWRGRQVRNGTE